MVYSSPFELYLIRNSKKVHPLQLRRIFAQWIVYKLTSEIHKNHWTLLRTAPQLFCHIALNKKIFGILNFVFTTFWLIFTEKQKDDHCAIDEFVRLTNDYVRNFNDVSGALKLLPLWLSRLLIKSGFLRLFNKHLLSQKTVAQVVRQLTSNKKLQTIFSYR